MAAEVGLIQLLTINPARAKAFYTEHLGFEVVDYLSAPDDSFIMLESPANKSQIALQEAAKETYGVALDRGGVIVGFVVADADATYQEWLTHDIEILGEVRDIEVGRMFTAKDPDGNFIQVYHFYPDFLAMRAQHA